MPCAQPEIESVVLSTETDKAVEARCRKIGIEVMQGVKDKAPAEEIFDGAQYRPGTGGVCGQ